MKKQFVALVSRSLSVLLLTCTLAGAEDKPAAPQVVPQLLKIEHTVLTPASEQVILQLNGSYSPKVFTLKGENPRIVFDFNGMTCGRGIKGVTVTKGSIVKQVRVGRHDVGSPKTRVVFDVSTFKELHYTQEFDAKNSSLAVRFTGPGKAAVSQQEDKAPAVAAVKKTAAAPGAPEKKPEAAPDRQKQAAAPLPASSPPAKEPAAATPPQPEPPHPVKQPASQTEEAAAGAAAREQESGKTWSPFSMPDKFADENAVKPEGKEPAPPDTTVTEPKTPARGAVTPPAPGNAQKDKTKTAAPKAAPQPEISAPVPEAEAAKAAPSGTAKPEETAKPASSQPTGKARLEYIKFDNSAPKGETVVFKLNGFHPPVIRGVEGSAPKVICDFNNTSWGKAVKNSIKAKGQYVKAIRASTTKKPEKVRVVIDLEPHRSYDLQQVFFKEDNIFVLFVNIKE